MTLTNERIALHREAAAFLARRREPGWTHADERALEAWLAADTEHQAIYDELVHMALDLRQVRRPRLASDAPAPARTPLAPPPMHPAPGWRRRAAVPALLSVLLVLAAGGYAWRLQPGYALEVATGAAETRNIALPDGTQVTLNAGSALEVRYHAGRRDTVLRQGEAFFAVAPDASRPFTVDSGHTQVRVAGTAFNVRAGPPSVVVKVLEGQVEVRPDRTRQGSGVLLLGAGAGVAIDTVDGSHRPVAAGAATVGDWRHGQLVFEQTPLAEVAAELARYLGQSVRLDGDAQLAALPVSGMAMTATPRPFLASLPHLLPVRVLAEGAGWRIVRR